MLVVKKRRAEQAERGEGEKFDPLSLVLESLLAPSLLFCASLPSLIMIIYVANHNVG